ncbi:hypothetical protein AC233_26100 [Burkholderia sp. HB1]|nr:hypothetical protein AC233_26100 [Burkholderia sp. HB1]
MRKGEEFQEVAAKVRSWMSPVLCATKWLVFFRNRNGLGIDMSDAWQSIKVVDQRRRHAGYSRPHDGRKNSRELANKTVNVIMLTTESSPAMKERRKAAASRARS